MQCVHWFYTPHGRRKRSGTHSIWFYITLWENSLYRQEKIVKQTCLSIVIGWCSMLLTPHFFWAQLSIVILFTGLALPWQSMHTWWLSVLINIMYYLHAMTVLKVSSNILLYMCSSVSNLLITLQLSPTFLCACVRFALWDKMFLWLLPLIGRVSCKHFAQSYL